MQINIDPAQFSSLIISQGPCKALVTWLTNMFPESYIWIEKGIIEVNGAYNIKIPQEYFDRINDGSLFDCGEEIYLEVENAHIVFKPYLKTECIVNGNLVKICFPKNGKYAKFYCKPNYGIEPPTEGIKFSIDIKDYTTPTIDKFNDVGLAESIIPFIEKSIAFYKTIREDRVINKNVNTIDN